MLTPTVLATIPFSVNMLNMSSRGFGCHFLVFVFYLLGAAVRSKALPFTKKVLFRVVQLKFLIIFAI